MLLIPWPDKPYPSVAKRLEMRDGDLSRTFLIDNGRTRLWVARRYQCKRNSPARQEVDHALGRGDLPCDDPIDIFLPEQLKVLRLPARIVIEIGKQELITALPKRLVEG